MKRLTERSDDKCKGCDEISKSMCMECTKSSILYDRLAEYEDAEEDGRLVVFPVAIGDHVWQVKPMPYDGLNEFIVTSLSEDANSGLFAHGKEMETGNDHYFTLSHLGKFIFTDKAEAEAKLKEMEKE